MSIEKIHLRKLLQLFYLPPNKRTSKLREAIRSEKCKELGEETGGGDFHCPFWADAKRHVAGKVDLRTEVQQRVNNNRRRKRLYPQLASGFHKWWDEKRRWRNEDFEFLPDSIKSQLTIAELDATVKIENMLSLRIGRQFDRIIYPYFSEAPALSDEAVRIGLTILNRGLPNYSASDLRVLDVLRGSSFGALDNPLQGNEYEIFLGRYKSILKEWNELKDEYR